MEAGAVRGAGAFEETNDQTLSPARGDAALLGQGESAGSRLRQRGVRNRMIRELADGKWISRATGPARQRCRDHRCGRAPLLCLSVLALCVAMVARAADAVPRLRYTIHWQSTGQGTLDATLRMTSQLEALRSSAPVGPYGLIMRARGDVRRLQTVLHSFGYYEGTITITIDGRSLESVGLGKALRNLPKGKKAHVQIVPALGPLFRIGRIDIQGTLPTGMKRELGLVPGEAAIAADVLAARARLQIALHNAGYALAQVAKPLAYERPHRHLIDLTFRVTIGPRVRIGSIRIRGLRHASLWLAQRQLPIHTGQIYDAARVERARQALLQLGLFSSVTVQRGPPDLAAKVPITFVVKESKRFSVGVSAAYSSDLGGSSGLHWSDHNVFGGGQLLSFSATAIDLGGTVSTGIGYDARIGYAIPDFRRRNQDLDFSITALRQTLEAYTQNGEMARATLTRRISRDWTAIVGAAYEHEAVIQQNLHYNYNLLSIPLAVQFNSTDVSSPLASPTHGIKVSLRASPTISANASAPSLLPASPLAPSASGQKLFVILEGSVTGYFDLHRLVRSDPRGRTVLAARLIAGVAAGASQFGLPPDQRFYAGGSGTVRGYRYQSVGPQFPNGDPEGGTSMQAVNLELSQRIGAKFGVLLFADGGGVSAGSQSVYRVGVGTGILYYTPIGPIRLEVAVPTSPLRNGGSFEVYIGLGQAL